MNEALVLTEVVKRFGAFTAVDRLSLQIQTGELVGFLGPNGAGKTTTLRMVMSLIFPDSGDIRVLGQPRASEVKDRIGYLPEERGLYRRLSVESMLRYLGRLKGLSGRVLRARVNESLERVALQDWRRKRVETLSKGMQQKLQFVATLLHKPELVILDEPFSGLDPLNTEVLKKLLADMRRDGTTVIFSTHQMDVAERLCDRIILINRGRKLLDGAIPEVRARYSSPIVRLEGRGDFGPLANFAGVARADISSGYARLELTDGADEQQLLAEAMRHARMTRFEVLTPDLHEIFVRLVGADVEPGQAETGVTLSAAGGRRGMADG